MSAPQQEFTFINVGAGKKSNTRAAKRHVSNLTNRRKRQEAVRQYQQSLLAAPEASSSANQQSPSSSTPSLEQEADKQLYARPYDFQRLGAPDEVISSPEQDNDYREFEPDRQIIRRQPFEIVGYWDSYREWAEEHLKPPPSQQTNSKLRNAAVTPHKAWRVAYAPAHSGIQVHETHEHLTIHIPRIDCPSDQSRMEWALRSCSDYIRGTYEAVWRDKWQDKQWYQASMLPLGIWRECFPLSVEFIQTGQVREAFYILNAALSVTPEFFKENHPGLLISILGAFMYTCQIEDERLSSIIRSHVTQLSFLHLGATHPISLLLREQMRAADAAHGRTDLLSIAVLNTMGEMFGESHFVPLSMRFGYVRRQLKSGQHKAALDSIAILEKEWNEENMPGAQLPRFVAFEKAKVLDDMQKQKENASPQNSSEGLSQIANSSVQLPVMVPGRGPALQEVNSAALKNLGKHLLFNSHYALALYIFTRIPEVIAANSPSKSGFPVTYQDPLTLPTTVSRILLDHFQKLYPPE